MMYRINEFLTKFLRYKCRKIKFLAELTIVCVLILVPTHISFAQEFLIDVPEIELRENPGINENIVGQLEEGEEVVSLVKSGEWTKVRTQKNVEGWIERSSMTEVYSYPRALFSVVAVIAYDTRTQEVLQTIPIEPTKSWLKFNRQPIRVQELGSAFRVAYNSLLNVYPNDPYIIIPKQIAVRIIDAAENILDEVILGEILQRLAFDGNLKEYGYTDDFVKKYRAKAYIGRRINTRAEIDSSGQLFLLETGISDYLQYEGGIPDNMWLDGPIDESGVIELRNSLGDVLWKKEFDGASANLLNSSGDVRISFDSGEEIFVDERGNILKKGDATLLSE